MIFYVIYQQVENYVIYPRVMSKSVDVPGAVTVIAALVGAALLGVVGALLAIPTAAAILMLTREVVVRRRTPLAHPQRSSRSAATVTAPTARSRASAGSGSTDLIESARPA